MKLFLKIFITSFVLVFICSGSFAQNAPEKLTTKIKEAYEVFNNRQYDKFSDYIADDYVDHSPFPGQNPGIEGFKDAFKMFFKAYPDLKFTIKDVIVNSDGTKASVLSEITGTNSGDFMGMPATNKKIDILGIDMLYFKGDKCSEHWGYADDATMMQQLGVTK